MQGISHSWYRWKGSEKLVLRVPVIIFRWSSRCLSLIERNLKSRFCLRRVPAQEDMQHVRLYVDYDVLQIVTKAVSVRHYEDSTALN